MRALFVLTTSESKRLIGKAVARMERVQRAMEKGKILISHGSTNVYVIEEILGKEMSLRTLVPGPLRFRGAVAGKSLHDPGNG